ncbi:energy transducer TonB [Luteibacter aegosomatissinici]|uniref:energy transducer TonB n=1 Tax=Luteibacter aegosomatissinici TaxID=2911539 RepID=UPI001FFA51D0|nr:hypothetical protein [Luteibacter aegosomatissinici]UPG95271.1 hypothetical protein L2Y97_03925 [Luteibacter aegosomatissinici]
MARSVLACLASVLLAACAHTPSAKPARPAPPPRDGKVSYEVIPAGGAGEYHMEEGQSSFGAQAITNDPPAYPSSLIATNLPPIVVRAKVIVDGNGKVSDVRDLDTAAVDASHKAFFAATHDAAMRWTYTPMTIVQEHEDARGNFSETRSTAPFSLDYAFRFELKDGKPVVSATQ